MLNVKAFESGLYDHMLGIHVYTRDDGITIENVVYFVRTRKGYAFYKAFYGKLAKRMPHLQQLQAGPEGAIPRWVKRMENTYEVQDRQHQHRGAHSPWKHIKVNSD